MIRKTTRGRDSQAWAGSDRSLGRKADSALVDSAPRDTYKLSELRHKIEDDTYVDSAVTRIANFLTNTLDKKGKNE